MQNYYKYKNDILSFWFSHKVKPFWYTKNENFDKELNNKFLDTYNQALSLPDSCKIDDIELILSFIILFDQIFVKLNLRMVYNLIFVYFFRLLSLISGQS